MYWNGIDFFYYTILSPKAHRAWEWGMKGIRALLKLVPDEVLVWRSEGFTNSCWSAGIIITSQPNLGFSENSPSDRRYPVKRLCVAKFVVDVRAQGRICRLGTQHFLRCPRADKEASIQWNSLHRNISWKCHCVMIRKSERKAWTGKEETIVASRWRKQLIALSRGIRFLQHQQKKTSIGCDVAWVQLTFDHKFITVNLNFTLTLDMQRF